LSRGKPRGSPIRNFFSEHVSASIPLIQRLAKSIVDAFVEVRGAKLPLVLFAFNWGGYFFVVLIALFMEGGISENEEWRIFILGWLVIPLASVAAVLLIAHLKRAYYADIEPFYPLLLAANALFWVVYFAYHFPPPWIYIYDIAPESLNGLVGLLPLVNLLALSVLKLGKIILSKRIIAVLYALLPIAALYVGINFSGFQIREPNWLLVTWPVVNSQEGENGPALYEINEGARVFGNEGFPLSIEVTAKLSATLQMPLPWVLLEGSKLTVWHVEEGEWIQPDRVLVEFESEFFHTKVSTRVPIRLVQKAYHPGDLVQNGHHPGARGPLGSPYANTLGTYSSLSDDVQSNTEILYAALVLGLVALLLLRLKTPSPLPLLSSVVIDCAVLIAAALIVFDLGYVTDIHHYNFVLGPVNDVLRGKALLVDINSQYGVGIIYFLALCFKLLTIPLNYQSFSFLLSTLLVLQYSLVYLVMRRMFTSQFFAVAALLLIIAANYCSQLEATLPSTGPLRFGLTYVLFALFVLRIRSGSRTWLQIALYALVGLSSVWSFESFTYTLTAYLCTELYTLLWNPSELKHKIHHLLSLVGGPAVAIAIGHLLLALFTFSRADAWPDWSHYFDYIALYSVHEFGSQKIEAWHPWALYIAVYFLSFILLLYKALFTPSANATSFAVIAGLTGFGIVQFTYFLGRSHPNNLYHICIPLIIIVAYWFLYLHRSSDHIPRGFTASITYCLCTAVFVLLAKTVPDFIAKWPRSPLYALLHSAPTGPTPWSAVPSHDEVRDALTLIERHAAKSERIALFLAPERTTEALMLSQKAHIFPMSNPRQDDLLISVRARALQHDHEIQDGDLLFITRNDRSLIRIQLDILEKYTYQMRSLSIDSTEHVSAFRLYPDSSRSASSP
jgi:hypothetical protein